MLLQLLSLAATSTETLAREIVEAMIGPITDVVVRLGHPTEVARERATLLVSALRGLCQDRLVTDVAAAFHVIETVVEPRR
ncbi:hypothetical protein [Streptomyces sp. NBC_01361]|uniref:hypothetical protein n=1 Tax=Streptomyces sp. NBC_01361 TaxID=2903838 RepID=UPI002E3654DE|nr:hypothetical protein [Streptomyces sp. NBC_01361]